MVTLRDEESEERYRRMKSDEVIYGGKTPGNKKPQDTPQIKKTTPEIIAEYIEMKEQSIEEADSYILKELRKKDVHLNRKYLGLVMNQERMGYDQIHNILYDVDPEVDNLDFEPGEGDFVLFVKKGKHLDTDTKNLREEGKLGYIQLLQPIGTDYELEAHIYDPENEITQELIREYTDNLARI